MSVSERPLWERTTDSRDGLELEVFAQPAVNLALVHNGVAVVQAVKVRNTAEVPQVDVTVTVTLHRDGERLVEAWSRTHDGELAPGAEVVWTDFGAVHPSLEHLGALNESHPAGLRVIATRTWGDECQVNVPIAVLAHNEWFNAPVFYGSLAAFVQPNTRAVLSVLSAASELLRRETGDASLGGYQGGPDRAAMIAAAIYEALRNRDLRYSDPPASFEDTGQKVRTTGQVLEDRFGTCVDLSVTYAACLEQAGLKPLIWLVDGHALSGFMRNDDTVPQGVVTESNSMANLVRSGRAVPVEAAFYGSEPRNLFSGAVASATEHFERPDSLRGLVVVSAVRREGVRPLPSLDETEPETADASAAAQAVANPLALPASLRASENTEGLVFDANDTSPSRVQQWKRALLDLSTRNRLLNLKAGAEVIDLVVPAGSLAALEDLVHASKAISLRAQDALGDLAELQGVRRAQEADPARLTDLLIRELTLHVGVTADGYQRKLKKLQRTARTLFEETGNANLYLTFGALIHKTTNGREARAPLFLVPARLEGGSGRSEFRVTVDPANIAAPNHCLVEWLRLKHNVSIPSLSTPQLDDSGLDIPDALAGIRAALVDHNLDLRVDEDATLAICQFSTLGMWQDLQEHWEVLVKSPVVNHLTFHAGQSFVEPGVDPDAAPFPVDDASIAVPIPADGSQLEAIALAGAGRTFVLEGPPGTGKSQTITNLIAHALGEGKTILFVAEKQAALEVVKGRLESVGLGAFALDLHGRGQQPQIIRDQLKRAMDSEVAYERRGWDAALAKFRARHSPLESYPGKVHDRNTFDYSLWSAAAGLEKFGPGPVADVPAVFVARPADTESMIVDALQSFARVARSASVLAGQPWMIVGRPSSELNDVSASKASQDVLAAFRALDADAQARNLVRLTSSLDELRSLAAELRKRLDYDGMSRAELNQVQSASWARERSELFSELKHFRTLHSEPLATFRAAFAVDGDLDAIAGMAAESQKGLLGKKKRREQFAATAAPFIAEGHSVEPEDVPRLTLGLRAAREHATRVAEQAAALLGGRLPRQWSPIRFDADSALNAALGLVDDAVAFARQHAHLTETLHGETQPGPATVEILERVAASTAEWSRLVGSRTEDEERWLADRSWQDAWATDAAVWAASTADAGEGPVRRWAQMVGFLNPVADAGLTAFRDQLLTGQIRPEDAEVAFLRGTATASVRERRAAGNLDVFEAALRDGEIDDFAAAAETLRAEQKIALPASLLAKRSFRPARITGRAGELRGQLDAKRNAASFRQLVERYGDLILEATPCVFVSPASLAQFIPPGSVTFDLVVFDEASQVTVPQAVGALGRGRSAVIVGDSQQMPPTSVGKVTVSGASVSEDDPEEEPVLEDLESILTECVESGFKRLWLSWHYRSQHESLIAFSNQHYYDGNLASLPSPGGDPTAGVEWRRLQGHFNREDKRREFRTNRVEAEAIVQEVRRRLADPELSSQSLGVVTFNGQQRDLVLTLLEESGDPLVLAQLRPDADEGIFVKNLENVQGDERDVILFTTAFSRKPDGSALPMNFGPISSQGGEKRLNVAVTRARRKVVMFTSFDPTDIDLGRTSSRGPADLRAYIEMADRSEEPPSQARTIVGRDEVAGAIADALVQRGFDVRESFGLSNFSLDLVVREAEAAAWQVAIVLDGPGWASRATSADRDLMPRLLTDMMSWGALVRVWLPEWLDDREAVLRRIDDSVKAAKGRAEVLRREREAAAALQQNLIEEALRGEPTENASDDGAAAPNSSEEEPPAAASPSGPEYRIAYTKEAHPKPTVPVGGPISYVKRGAAPPSNASAEDARSASDSTTSPPVPGERDFHSRGLPYVEEPAERLGERVELDRVNSQEVREKIGAAVRSTVEREGPIASERLARSIGRRFGFDRVVASRSEFILSLVPPELTHLTDLGSYVWPTQIDRATWRGYRATPHGFGRPLLDIAPEEIINTMAAVVVPAPITDSEHLFRETLAVFDQTRLTSGSRERLDACLRLALATGRLTNDGGRYRAGA